MKSYYKRLFSSEQSLSKNSRGLNSENEYISNVFITTIKPTILIGIVCLIGIWTLEASQGGLTEHDRYAYPVLMALLVVGFMSIFIVKEKITLIVDILFIGFCGYFLSAYYFIFSYLDYTQPSTNYYNLASISQWLPLVYVFSFLAYQAKKGLTCSIVFGSLLLLPEIFCHYAILSHSAVAHKLMFNIVLSHPVYICVLWCISYLKRQGYLAHIYAQDMKQLVNIDGLTLVANRRGIEEYIELAMAEFKRDKTPFCLIMLDIDYFKKINDEFGHLAGDEVLIQLVNETEKELRATDTIGRWGGEEFIVLLRNTHLEFAEVIAERIRKKLLTLKFTKPISLSASFGVINCLDDDLSELSSKHPSECLIGRADVALYKAKQGGRNRIEVI